MNSANTLTTATAPTTPSNDPLTMSAQQQAFDIAMDGGPTADFFDLESFPMADIPMDFGGFDWVRTTEIA